MIVLVIFLSNKKVPLAAQKKLPKVIILTQVKVKICYRIVPEERAGEIKIEKAFGFNCSKCVKARDVKNDKYETPKFYIGEIDKILAKVIIQIREDLKVDVGKDAEAKLRSSAHNPYLMNSGVKFEDVDKTPWECGSGADRVS